MTRSIYYEARHGLIWTKAGANVRTVLEAEAAAPHLLDMAITERNPDLSQMWLAQLADLVVAIRAAKTQEAANPVSAPVTQPTERAA